MARGVGIYGYACPTCGWSDIAEVSACPQCRSAIQATHFSKRGKISTFTVIRYPPRGFEKKAPYAVAIVALEKGPKVMGRVIAKPEALRVGEMVTFIGVENGGLVFKGKH